VQPTLPWLDRALRRLGGPRVLALPLLRILAVGIGVAWVALSPGHEAGGLVLAFVLYSAGIITALAAWPAGILRLNVFVLVVDLGFALALIAATGAGSAMFLALLVITGLQSYYYGIRRGVLVGVAAAIGYLVVGWPAPTGLEWANVMIRLAALVATAVGIGILGDLEDRERIKVLELTRQAQARERFITNVVGSLQEGVVALDADGRVIAWNEALERSGGVEAVAALGRDFFAVFPSAGRLAWSDSLRQLLAGTIESFTAEAADYDRPDGGRAILNVRGTLLREHGRPAGAVLLVEDVTSRVSLERSARQAEKLAAIGTLAAGVAHELNNPIGVISSRIELMLLDAESRAVPPDVLDDVRVLQRHAQRVARIAQGLLSFARQAPRAETPVDVNELVEDTLLLVEKSIVREGLRLTRTLAPGLPPIQGDANALQQVLVNLLTNARDALGGRGEIVIETAPTREPPGGVRLVVRDSGPGIPPEALHRVFDPFFTTKREGTGLGLSISYGIVRDHHGTVDVRSEPGRGTTFILTFPGAAVGARV
jgi:two-component system NtrC family sensor kinase